MIHTTDRLFVFLAVIAALVPAVATIAAEVPPAKTTGVKPGPGTHREAPDDPYVPVPVEFRVTRPAREWSANGHVSVQVNVAANGDNIVGDAANEPSIAVDPTDPSRIAIGWRRFDTIGSDFRQAGQGYSTDGGATWSAPVRVNDDPAGSNAWQWFGTMSVAPDGRIDVVWNDTRNDPGGYFDSELTYAFSTDGGATWSGNEALCPLFDPHLGWPQQNKIGDYYDMVSDVAGVHIAYAATFNGEQDVYYLHLDPPVLFADDFESGTTDAWSAVVPE